MPYMNKSAKNRGSLSRQNLRLKMELWEAIDISCAKRVGNVSRNTWITEAILEKLAREDNAPSNNRRANNA